MRAPKGQGSIKKSGKKWRYVLRSNGVEQAGPTVDRRADAKKAFDAKYGSRQTSRVALTLTDYFQKVQDSAWWKALSPTTRETHEGAFRNFLKAHGHLKPHNVTLEVLEVYRDTHKIGRKPRTVNRHMAGIQVILSHMGVKIDKVKPETVTGKSAIWLTPKQETEFVELSKSFPEYLRIACLIALRNGLRRGEICAVCHEDFEDGGLSIVRNAVRGEGTIVIKTPKNKRGTAWIPLHDDLKPFIGHSKGLVIKTASGKVIRPDNLSRALRINVEGTEFGPKGNNRGLGFHDLRRTFVMRMLEVGIDVVTASEISRHDPKVLLNEYTQSRRDLKVAAMKKMNAQGTKQGTKKIKSGSK